MVCSKICWFYQGYTLAEVGKLTFKELNMLMDNMVIINKLENPDAKEDSAVLGDAAALKASGFLKKKSKKDKKRKK